MAAIVGEAYVIVRAITDGVEKDIKKAFDGTGASGEKAGRDAGQGFNRGLKKGMGKGGISPQLAKEAEAARLKLRRLTIAGYFAVPSLVALAGAIGSVIQGLTTFATVLSRASQSAIVLVASLAALAQGAIAAKIGVGGVGNALKAADKAAKDSAGNNRALERAIRRVEDARIALRNAIDKEAPERLAEARERAVEAEERAADALLSSERALRTYNKAQQKTQQALDGLNDARDRAREKIQQLRFEVEGGAISERKARLEFEKTRDSLQRVQDLPPNSRARQEAELAFASADLNLRKAIDRNSDLKKEEQAATKAGVEGSQEVISANQAVSDAIEAERDALLNAAKAQREATKAREAANQAAADASAGGRVEKENQERIAQTRRALKDAQEDLADLQKKGGDGGLQEALEKLSPAARAFVIRFQEVKKEFMALRFAVQEPLFTEVNKSLETVVDNIGNFEPMLASTGVVLGDIVKGFTETFFAADNFGKLQGVWGTSNTLLGNFGKTASNLYVVLLNLLTAAEPLTLKFGAWIETLTGNWATNTGNNIDGLTERFNSAGEIVGKIVDIFKEFNRGFRAIGEAAMEEGGAVDIFLGYLERTGKAFGDLKEAENESGELGEKLARGTENFTKILDILGGIVKIFTDLGSGEGFGGFLGKIDEATDNLGGIGGIVEEILPLFGDFILQVTNLFLALGESGSFRVFFVVLTEIVKAFTALFQIPIVAQVFGIVAAVFAFAKAIGAALRILKFFKLAIIGNFIKGTGPFAAAANGKTTALGRMRTAIINTARTMKTKMTSALSAVNKKLIASKFAFLTSPFFLIPAAIIALGFIIWKFRDEIKEFIDKVIGYFRDLYNRLVGNSIIPDMVNGILDWFRRMWDNIKDFVRNGITAVVDFFKELPRKLLDALSELATKVVDFVMEYHPLAIIWRLVSENWETIKTWFTELPGKILDALKELGSKVVDFITRTHPLAILARLIYENWDEIKEWFKALPGRIMDALRELGTRVRDFIRDNSPILILFRFIREKWPEVKAWLTEKINGIADFFTGLPEKIRNKVAGMWDGLKEAFRNAINWIIDKWNNFKITIGGFTLPGWLGGKEVPKFTLETPNIPRLALGGIVPATRGGTLAMIGEGGRAERVEPLDPSGLSKRDRAMITMLAQNSGIGPTINVYPSPGMDERELADLVSRRLASQMRAGGI